MSRYLLASQVSASAPLNLFNPCFFHKLIEVGHAGTQGHSRRVRWCEAEHVESLGFDETRHCPGYCIIALNFPESVNEEGTRRGQRQVRSGEIRRGGGESFVENAYRIRYLIPTFTVTLLVVFCTQFLLRSILSYSCNNYSRRAVD